MATEVTPPASIRPGQSIQVIDYIGTSPTVAPTPINYYSALSVPAYWRAINLIADNLASFPRSVINNGVANDQSKAHPLNKTLSRRANGYQNPYILFRTWFYAAAHVGNGFLRIERAPGNYRPIALHNLLPEDIAPFRFDRGDGSGMKQYYLQISTKNIFPGEDVAHLQSLSHDGIAGMDPIWLHSLSLQHAATLTRYQVKFLQQGSYIRGFISIPGECSDETIDQIHARIQQFYSGMTSTRDVLCLSGGAELSNTTISPQDSQLVEQVSASTKSISQITGVAPELLFERSEAKYVNTVEQVAQDFVKFCLRGWMEQAENELTMKLLTDAEQDQGFSICMNANSILRGDTKTLTATVAQSVSAGVRTPNEGRDVLGLPPSTDPEADKLKRSGDNSPAPASTAE